MRSTTFFLHPGETRNRLLFVQPLDENMAPGNRYNMTNSMRRGYRRRGWHCHLILMLETSRNIGGGYYNLNFDMGMEFRLQSDCRTPMSFKYPIQEHIVAKIEPYINMDIKNRLGTTTNSHARREIVVEQALEKLRVEGMQEIFEALMIELRPLGLAPKGRGNQQGFIKRYEAGKRLVEERLRDFLDTEVMKLDGGNVVEDPTEKKSFWEPMPRADGRMEWTCEHGVGHGNHVHGCCEAGCCGRTDFPGKIDPGPVEPSKADSPALPPDPAPTGKRIGRPRIYANETERQTARLKKHWWWLKDSKNPEDAIEIMITFMRQSKDLDKPIAHTKIAPTELKLE